MEYTTSQVVYQERDNDRQISAGISSGFGLAEYLTEVRVERNNRGLTSSPELFIMLRWARPTAYNTCTATTTYQYGKKRTKQRPECSRSRNSADWTLAEHVTKEWCILRREMLIDLVVNPAPCQLAMEWTASE